MQPIYPSNHTSQHGYTLVELVLSTVLVGLVVTIFMATLLSMVSTVTQQKTQLELSQQNQIALDIIERDVRLARSFDTTLAYSTFSDTYGPATINEGWEGTWSYKGSGASQRALILQETATTTHPFAASRNPIFIQGFVTNIYAERDTNLNCTAYNQTAAPTGALTFNPKLPYYLIYFVRDNTLYRRTLTDTTTSLCSPQYQKQSCPSQDTTQPIACRANDEIIAQHVASFSVTYYLRDAAEPTPAFSVLDAYSSNDPEILEETEDILVTLRLQKTVDQKTSDSELSVRVSRVN